MGNFGSLIGTFLGGTAVAIFCIAVLFLGPWFSIIAVNTLFGTAIELNVGTWFAAFWINLLLANQASK